MAATIEIQINFQIVFLAEPLERLTIQKRVLLIRLPIYIYPTNQTTGQLYLGVGN